DDEEEKKCQYGFRQERGCSAVFILVTVTPAIGAVRPFARREPGELAAEYLLQHKCAQQCAEKLGYNVGDGIAYGNLSVDQHGNGNGRIDVATRNAPDSVGKHNHR